MRISAWLVRKHNKLYIKMIKKEFGETDREVYLWHGEKDISAPLAMGQYMAKMIPNCEAEFIKDAGHMWMFEHLPEMLEKLKRY